MVGRETIVHRDADRNLFEAIETVLGRTPKLLYEVDCQEQPPGADKLQVGILSCLYFKEER